MSPFHGNMAQGGEYWQLAPECSVSLILGLRGCQHIICILICLMPVRKQCVPQAGEVLAGEWGEWSAQPFAACAFPPPLAGPLPRRGMFISASCQSGLSSQRLELQKEQSQPLVCSKFSWNSLGGLFFQRPRKSNTDFGNTCNDRKCCTIQLCWVWPRNHF